MPFSSYEDRLHQLNLQTLQDRRTIKDLLLLYRIFNGLSDLCFDDFFILKSTPYSLRGNSFKIEPKVSFKSTQFQSTFFYRAPKYWNKLPEDVVVSPTVDIFKSKVSKLELKNL